MSKGIRYLIAALVCAIVLLGVLYTYKQQQEIAQTQTEKDAITLSYAEWKEINFGSSGLTVVAPSSIVHNMAKLEKNEQAGIEEAYHYDYSTGLFSIKIGMVTYLTDGVDLPLMVKQLASQLNDVNGVASYNYTTEEITIDGKSGLKMQGTADYQKFEKTMSVDALFIAEGNKFWQVLVSYDPSSEPVTNFAHKVLGSVHFPEKKEETASNNQ